MLQPDLVTATLTAGLLCRLVLVGFAAGVVTTLAARGLCWLVGDQKPEHPPYLQQWWHWSRP